MQQLFGLAGQCSADASLYYSNNIFNVFYWKNIENKKYECYSRCDGIFRDFSMVSAFERLFLLGIHCQPAWLSGLRASLPNQQTWFKSQLERYGTLDFRNI